MMQYKGFRHLPNSHELMSTKHKHDILGLVRGEIVQELGLYMLGGCFLFTQYTRCHQRRAGTDRVPGEKEFVGVFARGCRV